MSIAKWLNVTFASSSGKTPEFVSFAKAYKKEITEKAKAAGLELVSWSNGHFYCSAFLKNQVTGKLVYLSCSDVRFFVGDWANKILVRTAAHEKDYTGGQNNYSSLEKLSTHLRMLSA